MNKEVLTDEETNNQVKKIVTRRRFTTQEKEQIMNDQMKYGKRYVLTARKLKEGTLNSQITLYNRVGPEAFNDKRQFNQKITFLKIDEDLKNYIVEKRSSFLPVSTEMVKAKAIPLAKNKDFVASRSWLRNFLKRNGFSKRKKTKALKKSMKDILRK